MQVLKQLQLTAGILVPALYIVYFFSTNKVEYKKSNYYGRPCFAIRRGYTPVPWKILNILKFFFSPLF
jgi:hypothetical protein